MDGTIYSHGLDYYKPVGNCLTAPFIDLLSVGFAPSSSNSDVDERTDSNKKGIDRLSDLVNKIKQKQREIDNYNKIEKEYYL
jgi:hypothetical protein